MQGSRYYGENKYLSSIFQKQERQNKPIKIEETNTPFHFLKKEMSEEEHRQLMQKKIFNNPEQYASTHVCLHSSRSSAKFAIAISNSKTQTDTPWYTSKNSKEYLSCSTEIEPQNVIYYLVSYPILFIHTNIVKISTNKTKQL